MNARTLKIAIPALACAVALASCGSGEGSSPTTVAEPPPEPAESSEASDYSPPVFTATFWVTEDLEQGDGSTARQRFGLTELSPADRFDAPNGYESLAGACEVNPKRDALIPGVLIAEDTTRRFPIDLETGIVIERPFHESYAELGPDTSIAQAFSSGASCEPGGELEDTSGEVDFHLSDGETRRHRFLIVVHNYYSPGHPNGDEENLRFLRIGFNPYLSYRGWEALCVSASAPLDAGFVRLDGKPINEQDYETYETTLHAYDTANLSNC